MASLGVTWPVGMTVRAVHGRGLPTAVGVVAGTGGPDAIRAHFTSAN